MRLREFFWSAMLPPEVGPATEMNQRRENLRALYEVLGRTKASEYINWDRFAELAAEVGLHYDRNFGLMREEEWQVLEKFLLP